MAASKKKKGDRDNLLKQEDILQAVLLADSFNVRFAPITLERPRALLPLVNFTLLDYTLEFLTAAGVQEIFVYCTAHAEQIKNHLKESKWMGEKSAYKVSTIVSEDCRTVGDALRDIDNKSLLRSDFVLVNGDIVSNMNFKKVLEEHKARRQKDKSSVMTLVCKEASPGHKTRCKEDEFMAAVDTSTKRVFHYQKVKSAKRIPISVSLFQDNNNVQLRYDLLDTHICICSPQVPELFTDNFDYQTKDDFVHGILINEEIMGNQIHMYVLEDEYAARVSNPYMYHAVSKDIIHRWSYPLVPDAINGAGFTLLRHNTYLSKDITLARGCILEEDVVVGQGTCIGTNTVISKSVIGRNCSIGENVSLENAYVWDNVCIESGSTLKMCIVCDRAIIKPNVTVQPNCVISYDVVVGPDVILKEGTLLTNQIPKASSGFDDFAEDDGKADEPLTEDGPPSYDVSIVGTEGKGFVWIQQDEDLDEDEELVQQIWRLSLDEKDDEDEESSSDESSDDEMSPPSSPPPDDTKMFYNEVLDSLQRGIEENVKCDNLILEVNSSKYAYNISMKELVVLVMKAILEVPILRSTTPLDPVKYLAQIRPLLNRLKPLLQNYVKSAESQMDCLLGLEEFSANHSNFAPILMKVMHYMYDEVEVLVETVILKWYKSTTLSEDPITKQKQHDIRSQVAPFIKWLEEAEEESEDED
ncbi:translation initiation factor eIF2B subunit epsilon-like [Ptychodera flava]|uniref:translation initiation factor eIF2B subunit epsilon-like n=1 Tax=Ptychodera flava TaxID=63121 RepID=UPI003969C527